MRIALTAIRGVVLALGLFAGAVFAQSWVQFPGQANDVGVGSSGVAWVIGNDPEVGGYGIYRWSASAFAWQKVPGSAVRIDVDPQGEAWVVTSGGGIFRSGPRGFEVVDGRAKDVGIGANGAVWIIGTNKVPGGYDIWKRVGNAWQQIAGGGVRIDVDPQGNPWIVQEGGQIYRWDGAKWNLMPGLAKDVGIGGLSGAGVVYVVGTDSGVYKWNGSNWDRMVGGLENISVDPYGDPWGVASSKGIYVTGANATAYAGPVPTPMAAGSTNLLLVGQYLNDGSYLVSENRLFFAIVQDDGNFCVYRGTGPSDNKDLQCKTQGNSSVCLAEGQWCNRGTGLTRGRYVAHMQQDGNFCISPGTAPVRGVANAVWCHNAPGVPARGSYFTILQNDGNLCTGRGTSPDPKRPATWCSGSARRIVDYRGVAASPLDQLANGQYLGSNQFYVSYSMKREPLQLVSRSGTHKLVFATGGDLCLFDESKRTTSWCASQNARNWVPTDNDSVKNFVIQQYDGRFCLHRGSAEPQPYAKEVWCSPTSGPVNNDTEYATVVEDTGNVCTYRTSGGNRVRQWCMK